MKRLMGCLIIALLVAAPGMVMGQVLGSKHDFSGKNWNTANELCGVCHTPHNADASVTDAPLWNHEVTTATFTVYASGTLDATVGQPAGSSKLCLSCHDGTVAVDNFGGTTNGNDFIGGGDLIGTDLSNDHPISITYNTALATSDGDLYDPSTQNSGLGSTIDADMLISNKLECASCHDVHDGATVGKLLRITNASSALCLTCHSK